MKSNDQSNTTLEDVRKEMRAARNRDAEDETIPHVIKERKGCSSDNWCVNYAGLWKNGKTVTHCEAGIEYDAVKKEVEFTSGPTKKPEYRNKIARPCFREEHPLTGGCSKCRFPTQEEIAQRAEERGREVKRFITARAAIVAHAAGKVGTGELPCPVCTTGTLRYSISGYNGHIHAGCTTPDCVAWME